MNKIFLEDCRDTLDRDLDYDYVFMVPPDFAELGLDPKKQVDEYVRFLVSVFSRIEPSSGFVTIGMTDRKAGGVIVPKHTLVIDMLGDLGYRYVSQKIWCKSYKINLFRLNYSFVMTFCSKRKGSNGNGCKPYKEDVWNAHVYRHQGFNYAIALNVVKRCIMNFTGEGQVVYDPFMGSGTTAIACLETGRRYIGSEVSSEHHAIAKDRIRRYKKEKSGRMF